VSPDEQSERLRRLEAKIAAAKGAGQAQSPSHNEKGYSQAQLAWRMVTELVAGLLIGLLIGLGLDTLLGTAPILMVIFIGLGLAAGVRVMMRTAEEVGRRGTGAPEPPGGGGDGDAGAPARDAEAEAGDRDGNRDANRDGRGD
jgi:ATP synthase protein I